MAGQTHNAFLRQLSGGGAGQQIAPYQLPRDREVVIGRDARVCQLILDANTYTGVSGRHATIRPLASGGWEICDLDSRNGTYINGQRLMGCKALQPGDRISLGRNGPEFGFELQNAYSPQPPSPPAFGRASPPPVVSSSQPDSAITLTKLFPIVSGTGRDITRKGLLIPGIVTIVTVIALINTNSVTLFTGILGIYLALIGLYFVYQFCGKLKPWWWLIVAAIATYIVLETPIFPLIARFFALLTSILTGLSFREILGVPNQNTNLIGLLIQTFNVGLREELTKILPVIAAYFIGRGLSAPWRERLGVWEPLDGILLGAASSVGFTLDETLTQYVPNAIQQGGAAAGIALLFPRIVGEIAGHLAWSGYFGFFVGLSALYPRKALPYLAIGYLTAALFHALWDAVAFSSHNAWLLFIIASLSYAFLAAAILKARELSPTRSQNFATRFFK